MVVATKTPGLSVFSGSVWDQTWPAPNSEIMSRLDALRGLSAPTLDDRSRIKQIMDGGSDGIKALLGDKVKGLGRDIPAPNLMASAMERLGQKLGRPPTLRTDPPEHKDTKQAKAQAEHRRRIVAAYDEQCRLELQLPQAGRWLPGYGFCVWVVRPWKDRDGNWYPLAELRDPYDCFPGWFGPTQQPDELAIIRRIPIQALINLYPEHKDRLAKRPLAGNTNLMGIDGARAGWENQSGEGLEVAEYYAPDGTWIIIPERELIVDWSPSVLKSGPPFVVAKRFAFNQLQSQYHHVIGLMAQMAKINVLEMIAMEDAVFTEALALDTPLPTPTGWTTMGQVSEGDLLLGADGLPAEVLAATETQEGRDCFRVTFEGGTSIVASDGHLWESRPCHNRQIKIRTTREMYDDGRRFRVPASAPWKLPEAVLPIDPYVLGLWLGDGTAANATLCASLTDMPHMVQAVEAAGYTTQPVPTTGGRAPFIYISEPGARRGQNGSGLHGRLRILGLLNNKHVPAAYLRGSIDQRLALLQGLMDTDGCASRLGHCSFTNTNERIIDSLAELLRSLGEVPAKRWDDDARARSGGYWHITFTPRKVNPFHLQRKARRVHWHRRGPDWVSIRSIEPVDSVPVRCIAVASADHMFLAGRGAQATHNTNIIGEPTGRKYQRGRFAVNVFPAHTEISKPMNQTPYQLFSAISQAERQLRIGAAYPVTDDSESPTQWTTGRGIEQLQVSGISNHIREYQTAIRYALQRLDAIRLEMDETLWPGQQKPLVGTLDGAPFAEKYRPSEIQGSYRTRRIYGAMAGFDDASKIIAGIQLKDAGVIDAETFQENLDGLENLPRIRDRITRSRVEEGLFAMLAQAAQQGDPKAQLAIVEIHRNPGDIDTILDKFFTPKEPQVSPEEQAYMQQMAQQQMAQQQGPQQMPAAPSVMSALTRLESNRGGTPR